MMFSLAAGLVIMVS